MIKPSVMLMSDCGPDGKPWDWKAKLAEWKSFGLQGVDVFQMFLNRTNMPLKDMKAVLDDLGLKPTVYCIPTDLVWPDPQVRAKSLDTVRAGLDACRFLGVNHLFSHGGQHTNQGEEAFARYMDGLRQAAELAQE
ncbi:MAG: TIM barrel protein, partial [Victivallales bacterium]|nr:TIM barrel protein [Victivallales bacterium]